MSKLKIPKLVAIIGETASGKSALALEVAKKFDGEIISADSRTVYKGMDIGTAKPSAEDRRTVPHHLINVVSPDQKFTAADFKKLAQQAIDDISARAKLAIMAGGSGLYIDSVLFDYQFRLPRESAAREMLNKKSVQELQLMLLERDLEMPNNPKNSRHLIRAIETDGLISNKKELRPNTLIIGLAPPRAELKKRISERVDQMIKAGLVEEVRELAERYGWETTALQAPGYRAFKGYVEGQDTLQNAKTEFIKNDLALAKRQRTWFRRNKSIQWFTTPVNLAETVDLVTTFLQN